MRILGIETSCDETGAAVIEGKSLMEPVQLLSNSLATSLASHAETGGVIPEIAAREQVKYLQPVIKEALEKANVFNEKKPDIDAIAVTYGPGLIGSLLVGVETAKTLSYIWDIPLIPVNHMYGHIYANWIAESVEPRAKSKQHKNQPYALSTKPYAHIELPALALVVSGGHTDLVLIKNHGDLQVIGGTRDDAAGECFDKCARLLGYAYPGGPKISKLAEKGDPKAFTLPRPMLNSHDFEFSFSGLKTSFLNLTKQYFPISRTSNAKIGWDQIALEETLPEEKKQILYNLCASLEKAIIDTLVIKTMRAIEEYNVSSFIMCGGVAANKKLVEEFKKKIAGSEKKVAFSVPPASLCTDNAAMIASAGFYNRNFTSWEKVIADPELYY